ncbi:hypothetical protein ABZ249_25225 [Nocardiopsis sp. NPDC006139]|uniref:hypothetical protein n=1 Tax=Nocardiopsis sp. NPDC006139 TaxID=3154578 RepID=UPI0033AF51B2
MGRKREFVNPADDPIPDGLTKEEKDAVRRQGEGLAARREAGALLIGDPGQRRRGADSGYDFG